PACGRARRAGVLLVLGGARGARGVVAGDVVIRQATLGVDVLDRFLGRLVHVVSQSTGRKPAMSRIEPTRSPSGRHTASTREPTRTRSTPCVTTWGSAVSAPSRRTSTKANGAAAGCSPRTASCTTATAVTVPVLPTATHSPPLGPSISP